MNLKIEREAEGHPVLFQCSRKIVSLWGAYELQHRYRKALFGQTLFDVLPFNLAQVGFEQATFITINVLLMGAQPNNSCFHNDTPLNVFKCLF